MWFIKYISSFSWVFLYTSFYFLFEYNIYNFQSFSQSFSYLVIIDKTVAVIMTKYSAGFLWFLLYCHVIDAELSWRPLEIWLKINGKHGGSITTQSRTTQTTHRSLEGFQKWKIFHSWLGSLTEWEQYSKLCISKAFHISKQNKHHRRKYPRYIVITLSPQILRLN